MPRSKSPNFITRSKIRHGYAFAFISSALYGSIAPISKPIIQEVEPVMLACLIGIISAAIFAVPAARVKENTTRQRWSLIFSVSVLGAILAPVFYFIGLKTTSATTSTILSNTEIVFTVILALVIFRERIGRYGLISIIIVFSGAYLVTTDFANPFEMNITNVGNYFVLSTMFFWALDNNISKIIVKTMSVRRLVFFRSLIGGIILFPVAAIGNAIQIPITSLPSIVFLSLVGFTIPMFLFYLAIRNIGTIKTILIFSTSSVFGVMYAILFLGEPLQLTRILAVTIMILGIVILYKDRKDTRTDINVQGPK